MTERTGRCLCGAVRFTARDAGDSFAACHCSMCRRWGSGPFLAVEAKDLAFEGTPKNYASSDWAERGFCPDCGANLFYRVTAEGPHKGLAYVSAGALDEIGELALSSEIYIDLKPAGYAFEGAHPRLTEAQVMELMFGGAGAPEGGGS